MPEPQDNMVGTDIGGPAQNPVGTSQTAKKAATPTYLQDPFAGAQVTTDNESYSCLLYTSPSPRDRTRSRMPSSA